MTGSALIGSLRSVVGRRHVLTGALAMAPYCSGFRYGRGQAIAVVRPGTLREMWEVLARCIANGTAIVPQAANTSLTGGATPVPLYDRDAIVLSTLRVNRIFPIRSGRQVICLAGVTLQNLETRLRRLGREPHSVLGSSCIGASVIGGICNNSGGALVERGPAYTELSLFARISSAGALELVNELGVDLGSSAPEILARLEDRDFTEADVTEDERAASDRDYCRRVRDITSDEPARFNADPRRLHRASGCAGKLIVFAVRLDTFEVHESEKTFFISASKPNSFASLRRRLLTSKSSLPISAEYVHRETLRLAAEYGNDTVWLIACVGTSRMPHFFRIQRILDVIANRLTGGSSNVVHRCLQAIGRILPVRLPVRVADAIGGYEHHLILNIGDSGITEAEKILDEMAEACDLHYFRCSRKEGMLVSLYRFAAAGAAIRFEACHPESVSGIVSLDIALPRNATQWFESLPVDLERCILKKLYYGHFICHVLHQDYVIKSGQDCGAVKTRLLALLEKRGARYPAEHNFGHVYRAPLVVTEFYRRCDPTNTLNPGVGQMSFRKNYHSDIDAAK